MFAMTAGKNGIVRMKVTGRLGKADYEAFVPEFERLAAERGPLRILIELDGFEGWDAEALWEELKFDFSHQKDMGRVAIIGEKDWQEWGTWFSKPFFKPKIRYFERGETGMAERWLLGAAAGD
jgi:hypothetical protein